MDSLEWVDRTYVQKHASEDPTTLRAMYYPNLRLYSATGATSKQRSPMDAAMMFLGRYARRAALGLGIYVLSFLPVVGRFVLPAASFYTFNQVGPQSVLSSPSSNVQPLGSGDPSRRCYLRERVVYQEEVLGHVLAGLFLI